MNFLDPLKEHVRDRPDHPAIEDGGRVITYRELDVRITGAATRIQSLGVRPGDVTGVMLPDSAEHIILLCALARAGGVVVSVDPLLLPAEQERALSGLDVKAIIAETGSAPLAGARMLAVETICDPAPQADGAAFSEPALEADDPALIIQSSGTTGARKSVLRSHAQMDDWIRRNIRNEGWAGTDRYLAVMRMPFNLGRSPCLQTLYLGGTVVVCHDCAPDKLIAAVRDRGITVLVLAPRDLHNLLEHAPDGGPVFPSLRAMIVGTARLPSAQRRLARDRLTPNLLERYGINEIGLVATATPADQDAHPDAVGRLIEGVAGQVVDEDGRPLPTGEIGLIGFRAPQFSTAYIGNPEATARHFRDGWFYPGDLAALNAEGYIFFKGRADNVINNEGARKFYPVEVENALLAHPAVSEAAVFGWPRPGHGEVAVAFVVANGDTTPQELAAFCGRRIADYKVPHWIVFVPDLPRSPVGKILKTQLREDFREQLVKEGA
ncbi:MAG: class I adenylate-forming enzyme family protein [Alphaproteobacteria bacterium]|nr:class I adenylate-forming enzyme family protein [Alphaproteobacteria bacterium]